MFLGIITRFKWSLALGKLSYSKEWVETQGERDGWWIKKGAGRSCLLNHVNVKGIALTLSPLRAPSIHTNLLIDRRSSQTAPSPQRWGLQSSRGTPLWPHRLLRGAPTRTDYSGSRLTRKRHVDLKTTCSSCEYIMRREGTGCLVFLCPWVCCSSSCWADSGEAASDRRMEAELLTAAVVLIVQNVHGIDA